MSKDYNSWSLIISIASMAISLCAFIWPFIFLYLERPRLNLLLDNMIYREPPLGRKYDFLRILMINDGYRPLIISECMFWTSDNGTHSLGIYDTLKAPHGIADIVLPVLIEPGKNVALNITHVDSIHKITEISVFDSKRKEFKIKASTIEAMKVKVAHRKST